MFIQHQLMCLQMEEEVKKRENDVIKWQFADRAAREKRERETLEREKREFDIKYLVIFFHIFKNFFD